MARICHARCPRVARLGCIPGRATNAIALTGKV
jgi:hypothetical protein